MNSPVDNSMFSWKRTLVWLTKHADSKLNCFDRGEFGSSVCDAMCRGLMQCVTSLLKDRAEPWSLGYKVRDTVPQRWIASSFGSSHNTEISYASRVTQGISFLIFACIQMFQVKYSSMFN